MRDRRLGDPAISTGSGLVAMKSFGHCSGFPLPFPSCSSDLRYSLPIRTALYAEFTVDQELHFPANRKPVSAKEEGETKKNKE